MRESFLGRSRVFLLVAFCALLIAGSLATGTISFAQGTLSAEEALAQLEAASGSELVTSTRQSTGNVSFVNAAGGAVLMADDASASPEARALAFLQRYGSVMGIRDAARELQTVQVVPDELGMTHVRMNQFYNGLPVFGAQVVVHMNGQGITGVNGTFVPNIATATTPAISGATAVTGATEAVGAANPNVQLASAEAGLAVYRTGLLEGYAGENRLAYNIVVEGEGVKEQVWVDAATGKVLNRISLIHTALNRIVYTPTFDPQNPDDNIVRTEGDPPVVPGYPLVPSEADDLYDFSGESYELFDFGFGRDSYDGLGATMRTVLLFNEQCPNAYWNGIATNYCPGFSTDDVVAHEWGHAYTEYMNGLIYQYQSGALNEHLSDVWGETVDLHNERDEIPSNNGERPDTEPGNIPATQRWLVGEDLSEAARLALLRDMWNPESSPVTGPDPATVSSDNYACGTGDGGGVHSNSGVPNHAFAILTDGKTFNGQTVNGLGIVKTTQLWYRASDVYLTPSSNFTDMADALETSCQNLLGVNLLDFRTGAPSGEVLTAADCAEVAEAMLAVEMRTEPTQCEYQPILAKAAPTLCEGNLTVSPILTETWEDGTVDPWTLDNERAAPPNGDAFLEENYNWTITDTLPLDPDGTPHEGSAVFAINEAAGTCQPNAGDISGRFGIASPIIAVPDTAVLVRFEHWVGTESVYDGGNLKISVNGGEFVLVPGEQEEGNPDDNNEGGAFTYNAPNASLEGSPGSFEMGTNTSPLAGQSAWTGTDGGATTGSWGTTMVDLSLLTDTEGNPLVSPGDTIQLQYDFGIDGCNGITGWYVDRVEVYTCTDAIPTAISLETVGTTPTVQLWPLALGGIALAAGALVARRRRAQA